MRQSTIADADYLFAGRVLGTSIAIVVVGGPVVIGIVVAPVVVRVCDKVTREEKMRHHKSASENNSQEHACINNDNHE